MTEEEIIPKQMHVTAFCKNGTNVRNLIVFIMSMVAVNHTFTMMFYYMKYIPGSIFVNTNASAIADSFGYLGALAVVKMTSDKRKGFVLSYLLTMIAASVVAHRSYQLFETNELIKHKIKIGELSADTELEESAYQIPFGILAAKVGVAISFAFIYSSYNIYFDS